MTVKDFELLLVKDIGDFYELVGITYSTALKVDPNLLTLKASLLTIEVAKEFLKNGDYVVIPKVIKFSEVQPDELIVKNDNIDRFKQCVINEINAKMHQTIIGVSLIDVMNYLNNFVKLLNSGIFITNENREDKYFEIIEQSQAVDEPEQLSGDYSYDQEQQYIENKRKYDTAQNNLETLEKYLNAYDNLTKIQNICNILNDSKEKILSAADENEINKIKEEYISEINKFNE